MNLSLYSCLFDQSLYAAFPANLSACLPGMFVGGNFGPSACGCFVNYTYRGTSPIGMIPAPGVRTGTGLFDYTSLLYSAGFIFEQVYYSTLGSSSAYYIAGYGQDALANSYPGVFRFDITNNSFTFSL